MAKPRAADRVSGKTSFDNQRKIENTFSPIG
jgi:hypothetical protein